MVSSYLICDVCGSFGPPAGFLSQNGLRLCYRCWLQERQEEHRAPAADPATGSNPASTPTPPDPSKNA